MKLTELPGEIQDIILIESGNLELAMALKRQSAVKKILNKKSFTEIVQKYPHLVKELKADYKKLKNNKATLTNGIVIVAKEGVDVGEEATIDNEEWFVKDNKFISFIFPNLEKYEESNSHTSMNVNTRASPKLKYFKTDNFNYIFDPIKHVNKIIIPNDGLGLKFPAYNVKYEKKNIILTKK